MYFSCTCELQHNQRKLVLINVLLQLAVLHQLNDFLTWNIPMFSPPFRMNCTEVLIQGFSKTVLLRECLRNCQRTSLQHECLYHGIENGPPPIVFNNDERNSVLELLKVPESWQLLGDIPQVLQFFYRFWMIPSHIQDPDWWKLMRC